MANKRFDNIFSQKNLVQPNEKNETNSQVSEGRKTCKPKDERKISFDTRDPIYRLSDVVLNDEVKGQIRALLSRIRNHKLLYETWGLSKIDPLGKRVAINFYGPPGTGKTMCAEALASELQLKLLEVSYADIESMYVGETGKNIREAFKTASEKNALLFFDEADAILGRRMSNVTQAADHAVDVARAVMLKALDAFEGCVVFATNKFDKFDQAFVRRIMQHVEVPIPDEKTSRELWRHMIVPTIPGCDELDIDNLAKESLGLSGGYIKNCIIRACAYAVDDLTEETKKKSSSDATVQTEKKLTQAFCLRAIREVRKEIEDSRKGTSSVSVSEQTIPLSEFQKEENNPVESNCDK